MAKKTISPGPGRLAAKLAKESETAPFVFRGVVRAVGENNLQGIAAEANHALVEVEEVLAAPGNLGDLRGRVLTVVLQGPAAKKGTRGTWWATSWVFGQEIGVIETARAEAKAGAKAMRDMAADVTSARLAALDAQLAERIAGADLIFAGIVTSVDELGPDGIAEGTTWRRAHVRVTQAVKGAAGAEEVIQFPGAGSPRWASAPRFVVEQQGVWLCRRPAREAKMAKVSASGVWVALDPADIHTLSNLARIEALVQAGSAGAGTGKRR